MMAGDSHTVIVDVTDEETQGALDLSGVTIEWVIQSSIDASPPVIKDTTAGITKSDTIVGQFSIELDPMDTHMLLPTKYAHQATITDEAGNVTTVMVGTLTLLKTLI
jgi:hypothetical protein